MAIDEDWHWMPPQPGRTWSPRPYLYWFLVAMAFSVFQLYAVLLLLNWK